MDNAGADRRGRIIEGRNVWRINNALVEEVSANNRQTGFIIISYAVLGEDRTTSINQLRLNINRNTIIRNRRGMPVRLGDIQPGTWIDASFSPVMTRSIPPQTTAFQIIVNRENVNPRPPERFTTTSRIIRVDRINNRIVTGNPINPNRQMIFNVSEDTQIFNRWGRRIPLRFLRTGQLVEVTYSNAQTLSIPPQSTAFIIQVI